MSRTFRLAALLATLVLLVLDGSTSLGADTSDANDTRQGEAEHWCGSGPELLEQLTRMHDANLAARSPFLRGLGGADRIENDIIVLEDSADFPADTFLEGTRPTADIVVAERLLATP